MSGYGFRADGPSLQKASEILEGEEYVTQAVLFDPLKPHPGSQSQLSSQIPADTQPEYFCISPDTRELADVGSAHSPTAGSQLEPSEEEQVAKSDRDVAAAVRKQTFFIP